MCTALDFTSSHLTENCQQALLMHNAKVYMASRNEEKALAAITQLERETGRRAIFLKLDLANLSSVKAAAQQFMRFVLRALTSSPHIPDRTLIARRRSCTSCSTTAA